MLREVAIHRKEQGISFLFLFNKITLQLMSTWIDYFKIRNICNCTCFVGSRLLCDIWMLYACIVCYIRLHNKSQLIIVCELTNCKCFDYNVRPSYIVLPGWFCLIYMNVWLPPFTVSTFKNIDINHNARKTTWTFYNAHRYTFWGSVMTEIMKSVNKSKHVDWVLC